MDDDARTWLGDDGAHHIDVRGLPPPQPLVRILQLVHTAGGGATVIVHHDREPVLLYAELAQIGWGAERVAGEPGQVRLRLRLQTGP